MQADTDYRVRLVPITATRKGQSSDITNSQVIFEVTPNLTETGSVDYSTINPVHLPGGIQIYKHTNSRTFEIQAKLISRNVDDAIKNMKYLQAMRSWRYPFFGATNTVAENLTVEPTDDGEQVQDPSDAAIARAKDNNAQLRGAPPEVLYLYAYATTTTSSSSDGSQFQFINLSRIPVVLTSLSITYDDESDYIPVYIKSNAGTPDTSKVVPFPIKISVNLSLAETHSPLEYEKFDLMAYKRLS